MDGLEHSSNDGTNPLQRDATLSEDSEGDGGDAGGKTESVSLVPTLFSSSKLSLLDSKLWLVGLISSSLSSMVLMWFWFPLSP